jgi:hypothetical protein
VKEQDILTLVKQQLRNCAGWENDEISRDRKTALDYYHRRPRGDEVTGRSTVVSGDVSASVEADSAQMLDAFSSDHIVEFDALDAEDELQAQLETDAVVQFVMKKNNGFLQLAAAIKECLLLRNGFIKCWVDLFTETRTRTFDNVDPIIKDELLAKYPGSEELSYKDRTLRLRVKREHKKFRAEAIPWLYYPKNWHSFDLQECPFVAERHVDTRSELIRMGFPKAQVQGLRALATDRRDDVGTARNPGVFLQPNTNTPDKSQDLIEWFECYALIDVDGDGVAERRNVSFVWDEADELLEDQPCYLVPYAVGAVILNPHRLTGISVWDKLFHTQDEHTGLKRALYDNVNTVTKNRVAYLDGTAVADDMGDGRPNGAIRVRMKPGVLDVRQAIMPFAVPDNSANILANIEALKRERTELGGAALDLATGQTQIGGDRMGSQGLDRAYSVMEQNAAMMTKVCAATLIRGLFLLAHATLRENFTEPVSIKRNGKWETAVPAEWRQREELTVKIGMSPGERARIASTLRQMLNDQVQLVQAANMDEVLVNLGTFYRTYLAWLRVSDIRNPEQFWLDPESDASQQALELKSKSAAADAQKRQNLLDRAIGKEEAVVALDKYKHDSQLELKYWEGVNDSEIEEAKIVGHATTELLKARETPANGSGAKAPSGKTAKGKPPARRAPARAPAGTA